MEEFWTDMIMLNSKREIGIALSAQRTEFEKAMLKAIDFIWVHNDQMVSRKELYDFVKSFKSHFQYPISMCLIGEDIREMAYFYEDREPPVIFYENTEPSMQSNLLFQLQNFEKINELF